MNKNARRRADLRSVGPISASCSTCQWRPDCGGSYSGRVFGNCFELTCCHYTDKDPDSCNAVCPYKEDFGVWLRETRGLRFDDLPSYTQNALDLPLYVPLIDHGSRRRQPFSWPCLSLDTYNVLRLNRHMSPRYRAVADGPDALRDFFKISRNSRVILRGVGTEPQIERYWEYRDIDDAAGQLSRLSIEAAIGPNFSQFIDCPRTDHLFNRRRHLICLHEMMDKGVSPIPHCSATSPGDWSFWRSFLRSNSSLHTVAFEFQTGNKSPVEGLKAIRQFEALQQAIGRPIHLILVGGAQFVEEAARRFANLTILDSVPFFKALHRQLACVTQGALSWDPVLTLRNQDVDWILASNVAAYSEWIATRASNQRR